MNLIMPNYYSSRPSHIGEALYGGNDAGINTHEKDSAPEGMVPSARSEAIFVTIILADICFFFAYVLILYLNANCGELNVYPASHLL